MDHWVVLKWFSNHAGDRLQPCDPAQAGWILPVYCGWAVGLCIRTGTGKSFWPLNRGRMPGNRRIGSGVLFRLNHRCCMESRLLNVT
jgi:hypothetical protein